MKGGLFTGTAPYYARYRTPFPSQLIDQIVAQCGLTQHDLLFDVGCGTGALTVPLARHVGQVIAIDPDPEMLDIARSSSVSNVEWRLSSAEEAIPGLTQIKATTFGRSFHWLDRGRVLQLLDAVVIEDGSVAIANGGGLRHAEFRDGSVKPESWEARVVEVLESYVGPTRLTDRTRHSDQSHVEVLSNSPFSEVSEMKFFSSESWAIDDLIGYFYSTSFAGPSRWSGNQRERFETELRSEFEGRTLLHDTMFELIVARRPQ